MEIVTSTLLDTDIGAIIGIQSENLRQNLTADQLKEGYLSIAFSEDEFRAFNRDLAVVVARAENELAGYCCVSSAAYNEQFPILDQIVSKLSSYQIPGDDTQPTKATTCIYGPACIATDFRGKNVLRHLFSHALTLSRNAGYCFCFSFISSENHRSLKAHLKLPFQKVGQVTFNDNEYVVIACKT